MIKDLISRQAVLEQTYNWSKDEFLRVTNPFDYLRKRIDSLPSVNVEQKTGYWIEDNDGYGISCSECGKWYTHPYLAKEEIIYCCKCGAKMMKGIDND